MAFAVTVSMKFDNAVWEDLFVPPDHYLLIRNWATDAINYTHSQKLDLFDKGGKAGGAPGGAAAWVA
jgi:hypothetical protein